MKCLVSVLFLLVSAGVAFGEKPPTQEEFDEIVDREMFKFIHGEDYRSEVRYWKSRGVTDEMFGKAYVKIARRTINDPVRYDHKCEQSIDGIAEFCSGEMQLTNLLFMAEHARVDAVRSHAIWVLSTKTTPVYFTAFAERVVASTNLGHRAASQLMSCLSDVYPKIDAHNVVWRRRVLQTIRRHLEVGGKGSVIADRTLSDYDRQYRDSEFRKRVAERILDPLKSPIKGDKCIRRKEIEEEFRRVLKREGKK